jgi:hypothetical protein
MFVFILRWPWTSAPFRLKDEGRSSAAREQRSISGTFGVVIVELYDLFFGDLLRSGV